MTRRIRFTPLLAAGCFLAGAAAVHAEPVPFVPRPPITTGDSVVSVAAADLDRDGDLDLLTGRFNGLGAVWALENTAGDGSVWTARTIATTPFGVGFVTAADLDGDGDQDAVVVDAETSAPFWVENTGAAWAQRSFGGLIYSASALTAVDLDGDGDLDLATVGGFGGPKAFWYENTTGDASVFTRHTIATLAAMPRSVAAADLDRDGDPDLVVGTAGAVHVWLENVAADASAWTVRTLATAQADANLSTADVDRDGDADVVAAGGSTLGWLENAAGDASTWTRRTIATTGATFHSAQEHDLDADGDLDVLTHSGTGNHLAWYENAADASAWTLRVIATDVPTSMALVAADLDRDGDLDVTTAAFSSLVWHRNQTLHQNACFVPRTLASGVSGAQAVVPADVDGDGDTDAVSTAFLAGEVLWHDNTAGDASAWATRTVATGFPSAAVAAAGDVDRDGDVDVAAIGAPVGAGTLAWFANAAGDGSAWTRSTVSTAFDRATHVELADLSGDGDLDLLGAGYYSSTLLFENAAGNGSAWTTVTLPAGAQTGVATGDLDGDGDLDVTSTESFFGDGLSWTRNAFGDGSVWTQQTIATAFGVTYAMATADIDGDGDLDVLEPGANFLVGTVFWFENVGGSAPNWTQHAIPGAEASIAAAADLDRDGDVDMIAPGPAELRFWENTSGSGLDWTQRAIAPVAGAPRQLATADLDRDGDPDILSATAATSAVNWYENRGGQASLAVVDQAPSTANNGDLVSMLRATVMHLGRAGEGPVELGSLGLLFEETPGDPLTSAEVNALVESLRVYRDANGNGVFEPATDVLVTSVPTLTLTGGVATVAFADGDANVQVAVDSPRTYFVVAEIAAAASGQVPNQFRVTLLQTGAARSVVEDFEFDIPLRLACPADVSSTIRQVVPVELTGFTVE